MQALGGDRAHAGADLQARRQRSLLRGLRARLTQGLVHQVFKHRARTFKAVGADVRQVVGDNVHIGLLGVKTGFGDP